MEKNALTQKSTLVTPHLITATSDEIATLRKSSIMDLEDVLEEIPVKATYVSILSCDLVHMRLDMLHNHCKRDMQRKNAL